MLMMIVTACVITVIALVITSFTLNADISSSRCKAIAMVSIALVVCISYLLLHPRCQMTVFKAYIIEGDIKIENIVFVSDGRELYIPEGITFTNVSSKNIESIKLFIKKQDDLILDLMLGMDGMKVYEFDQDRHVYDFGINNSDEVIIDLTYVIDGVEKHTTTLLNLSDYKN